MNIPNIAKYNKCCNSTTEKKKMYLRKFEALQPAGMCQTSLSPVKSLSFYIV